MTIGVIVLAAGLATRFGSDKRVAHLADGRRMINATVTNARDSGLPLLVCLRTHDHQLAAELVAPGITCLQCHRADEGMGATLAEGIRHTEKWDGALIALADMPWIKPDSYERVAAALTRNVIVQPHYGDKAGHPVGFGADFFPALTKLSGDAGGRQLLHAHAQRVQPLQVDDPAIRRDVDRPDDLLS